MSWILDQAAKNAEHDRAMDRADQEFRLEALAVEEDAHKRSSITAACLVGAILVAYVCISIWGDAESTKWLTGALIAIIGSKLLGPLVKSWWMKRGRKESEMEDE